MCRPLLCKFILLAFGLSFSNASKPPKPRLYSEGEKVELMVNSLTSLKDLYPLEYYRFPFCQPWGGPRMEKEYFGEFMAGDRIQSSPYKINMLQDSYCEQLCISNLGRGELRDVIGNKMVRGIQKEYSHNWILDGLVSASKTEDDSTVTTRYWEGFPLGFLAEDTHLAYVHNHVNIEIQYHRVKNEDKYQIVRFTVEPFSILHDFQPIWDWDDADIKNYPGQVSKLRNPIRSCDRNATSASHTNYDDMMAAPDFKPQPASGKVLFTYDVLWRENEYVNWADRWDIYLSMDNAIPQGFLRSVLFCGIVMLAGLATILAVRVTQIKTRQHRYQNLASSNDLALNNASQRGKTTTGIQALHGDVFRPPDAGPRILALFLGAGAHLLCTVLLFFVFALRHSLNPEHMRASVIRIGLIAFGITSPVGGFGTAWVSKTFLGQVQADFSTLAASMWFPVLLFGVYEFINTMAWYQGSTLAVLKSSQLHIILWFFFSTPLAMAGAYFGNQQSPMWFPVQPRSLRRQIPPQPVILKAPWVLFVAGALPCLFSSPNYYFMMHAVWDGYYFLQYAFSLMNFVLALTMSAVITILLMLYQFQKENHRWWWRSFCMGGSPAFYLCAWSLFSQDHLNMASLMLYVICEIVIAFTLFLMMGFVSVSACLCFNAFLFQHLRPIDDVDGEEEVGYLMIDESSGAGHLPEEIQSEADASH
jgi:transmembrane 9 superfamily protein 2/4